MLAQSHVAAPWSAGNAVLDWGLPHRCFPWFVGGGWRGRMALHRHAGAPAAHVPRLLADGVGAGSQRDRHGHRGGGKGVAGSPLSQGEGRGGQRMCFVLGTWLRRTASCGTISLQILFRGHCTCLLFSLPRRWVSFPKDNLLAPVFISFSLFSLHCHERKLNQKEPAHFCVPDNTIHSLCPGTREPGLLWVHRHLCQPRPWPADVRHAYRGRRRELWVL